MLYVDPWCLLEPDGSLPLQQPQLWPKVMQLAEAIQAGWDLPRQTTRQTLLLCTKRPQRKRCPGPLWVARQEDDRLLVFCPVCNTEQMLIQNWQSTPWAGVRPAPVALEPETLVADQVDLDQLAEALSLNFEDWQSYLDLETGEILNVPGECFDQLEEDEPSLFTDVDLVEEHLEEARRIHEDATGRFAAIDPLESHERFAIMESFLAELPEGRMRRQLENALRGRKPFRRFKDELQVEPAVRERWFRFEREALRAHASRWLEEARAGRELTYPATSRR